MLNVELLRPVFAGGLFVAALAAAPAGRHGVTVAVTAGPGAG